MASAFRRSKGAGTSTSAPRNARLSTSPSLLGAKGIKPWTGGIHLTSTGLNDLDSILGGGQPLGTCVLIQEDRWNTDLAHSLVKYWCAEAISQDQRLVIPVTDVEESNSFSSAVQKILYPGFVDSNKMVTLLSTLPRNLHWDKQSKKQQSSGDSDAKKAVDLFSDASLPILQEEMNEEDENEEGLEIAWQYRKSVQAERSGLASATIRGDAPPNHKTFCHSYDLSGRLADQKSLSYSQYLFQVPLSMRGQSCHATAHKLFCALVQHLEVDSITPTRLLLFHPDLNVLSVVLPLIMVYVRSKSLPVVVFSCVPPSAAEKQMTSISRCCDVVAQTEGFTSRREYPPPPEFRHLQGVFTLSKAATVTAAAANGSGHFADLTYSKRPPAYVFGLKRDRRKLHIPLLHIPPEDYAAGGGSTSGVRSGAGKANEQKPRKTSGGMGCSANGGQPSLDF